VEGSGDNTNGWSPPTAMTGSWRIYVLTGTWSGGPATWWDFKINGSSIFSEISSKLPVNTSGWVDLGTKTINAKVGLTDGFSFSRENNSSQYQQVRAIEYNGTILVDNMYGNSWTPVNFGGSNIIPKATGALPILNTVNGGTSATVGVRRDYSSTPQWLKDSGCVKFDGSGDYLISTESSAEYDFPSGDWTIEYFSYCTSEPTDAASFSNTKSFSSAYRSILVEQNSGNLRLLLSTDGSSSWTTVGSTTNDLNRWRHIALVRDSGTVSFYVDGISLGSTSSTPYDNANNDTVYFGRNGGDGSGYFNGFISNARIIKGTALYTAAFTPPSAPLTNVTNTKLLCCQSNTSAIAAAVAPGTITANGDAAATNFNPFTDDINAVMGQETGYCTLNPLDNSQTLSNGNLSVTGISGNWRGTRGTIGMSSGKFYWEWSIGFTNSSSNQSLLGIAQASAVLSSSYASVGAYGWEYYSNSGQKFHNGSNVSYGDAYTIGDVIGASFDADNGKLTFYKNGVSQGEAYNSLTSGSYYPSSSLYGTSLVELNFGQKPFKYAPPEGFQPLNYANLPSPEVVRPDQYVGVTTYNGSGSAQVISGVGFQPDLIWTKNINSTYEQNWVDSVRGSTSFLSSSETVAAFGSYGYITPNHDGYVAAGGWSRYNYSGEDFVTWCWKAGGNKNTFNVDDVGYASASDAGLDGGNINPSGASINTRTGFSILKYAGNQGTGQTLNHGLGEIPDFVICKNLDTTYNWFIWHNEFGNGADAAIYFTTADKTTGYVTQPFGTFTTSSLAFNNNDGVNGNDDYICYAWKNIPGLQKFGSYEGNNSTDGTFTELGFRPAVILIKNIDATNNWVIYDTVRDTYNPSSTELYPDTDGAEFSSGPIDILSNGFKQRSTHHHLNKVYTYIYCAWAEAPMNNLYGGQSNAR